MADSGITLYGTFWCPDCRRSKKFLGEQMVHYTYVDIEQDEQARHYVESLNNGKRIIPTITFPDGSFLVEPSNAKLAAKLGLSTQAKCQFYELIIVGAGPTGLTTAIYTTREGTSTLVIERSSPGGNASVTEKLDNFPGFPEGITGSEFSARLAEQARRFGAEILKAQDVVEVGAEGEIRFVKLEDGKRIGAQAILIATGSTYRMLNVKGEDDFLDAGIHYCATCDGPFYKGMPVAVIGSGNSAAQESVFLTRFASHVTLLSRGSALKASKVLIDKIEEMPQITPLYNTEVAEFRGDKKLATTVIRHRDTGQLEEIHPAGVFVFVGLHPNTDFLKDRLHLDEGGFIVTGHELIHDPAAKLWPDASRAPLTLETSVPGIFAAGDCREGSTKQVAAAAGEGASAAIEIREYLRGF